MVSRGMCVNWNELRYLACATSELQPVAAAATRSAVAPHDSSRHFHFLCGKFPGIYCVAISIDCAVQFIECDGRHALVCKNQMFLWCILQWMTCFFVAGRTSVHKWFVSLVSSFTLDSLSSYRNGGFPVPHFHHPHLDPASGRYCEQL